MKRSEFVNIIHNILLDASDGYVKPGIIGFSCPYKGEDRLHAAAAKIIEEIDPLILPPTQECTLIEDTLRGGQKHSPTLRVWDEE